MSTRTNAPDRRAGGAPGRTNSPAAGVAWAFWLRSLNEVTRVRGALIGTSIAPLIFLLGTSGQFGKLVGLPGFPTDSYLSWIVPLCCLQGAGFAGAAAGANLARDIEQGWFDRLLVAPVARPLLILGPVLGAVTRALAPVTLVLVVGLAIGAELTGGLWGIVALYVASVGFCTVAAMWGIAMAVHFRTQQAGPLMQMGVFLGVFLSTAYTPQPLLEGWLATVARINPVSHVLELARQSTVSGIAPSLSHTWPGLVALAGMIAAFGALALVGLRRMGR
jgi:ABC-type multidrug transport system permease subunit